MNRFFTKIFILCLSTVLLSGRVMAQQEPQYTQFVFNKMAYNPAFAGTFASPVLTAIYRNQWMGIDGSPNTQVLSYNMPWLNDRMGIGASLTRHSLGITKSITFDLAWNYRIEMRRGVLRFGVQPSIRNMRQNWSDDRLYSATPAGTDLAIPIQPKSKLIMNLGAGIFYSYLDGKWFAGFALPRFFNSNIDFAENGGVLSKEERQYNVMAGARFSPNDDLVIKPELLVKYVLHTPLEVEVCTTVLLREKFMGGLSYRVGGDTKSLGESIDLLAGLQATDKLFFCLSYDIGLTRLRKYSNGSIEATARWYFNPPSGSDVSTGQDFRN